MIRRATILGLGLIGLILAGCDTYEFRAKEKSATFAALTPAQREKLKQGSIQIGDTPDMVYIALGEPDERHETTTASGHDTIWIYNEYHDEMAGTNRLFLHRRLLYDPTLRRYAMVYEPCALDPFVQYAEEYIRVTFRQEKVAEIEQPKN